MWGFSEFLLTNPIGQWLNDLPTFFPSACLGVIEPIAVELRH